MFTLNNWNYSRYSQNNLKVIINLTATPVETNNNPDCEFLYSVTLLDENSNEVHQEDFSELNKACEYVNAKYLDIWDFEEVKEETKSGGCGSCVAH